MLVSTMRAPEVNLMLEDNTTWVRDYVPGTEPPPGRRRLPGPLPEGAAGTVRRMDVTPFRLAVPDADLDDLRERLRRTRWPERETVDDWSQGVPLAYLQELCALLGRRLRLAGDRGAAERAAAVPHRDRRARRSTSSTCARRTRTRCRWCSRTAGRARSSSSST